MNCGYTMQPYDLQQEQQQYCMNLESETSGEYSLLK